METKSSQIETKSSPMEARNSTLVLKVISPERTLLDCSVRSVEFCGALGPFMVLRDHAPLVSSLESGPVRYTTEDGTREEILVRSGFVTVSNNRIIACVEL
ncbi:MAG: hypothetical protein PUD74_06615 [Bacteroidales bacterium]|uniref:F0F1 ATP synthase subunit epsilon n=1 Tax=Candidatus Cryptobacteroides sp. TaxID=2952915 RepID=UPI002A71618C|nr:hypothetical protein [Candidatus Cryptobacteroides sp.]MDD5915853.1 hypothetical protein [Bacteroidales bacterium]MDD6829437.1 hypothetical protein [Bacteroidales bacterium]MDD7136400.1 hypothetical protein [Bacteroidales bacterium]MDY5318208.1 hypothetical protein [Candidatus Cryptobacteroides sp.]MDY5566524.1 hypothetical protein [Candidatus Cryptobacteroides sp.]